jgi:hypothetical protein
VQLYLMHTLVAVEVLRESEVYKFQRGVHARLLEQKVLHLQVSVCYALLVQVAHSGEHIAHQLCSMSLRR